MAIRGVGIWRLCPCWAVLALLACLFACLPGAVRAQESALAQPGLNWVRLAGADDCLSAAELADKVERRIGRTLFVATTEAELFVDGFVRGAPAEGSARAFEIELQVSRRSGEVLGERALTIEGESCSAIDDAVTLVIAVTLYPRSSLVTAGIPLDPSTAASLSTLFGDEPTDPDPATLPVAVASADRQPPAPTPPPAVQAERGTGDAPRSLLSIDAIGAGALGQLPNVRGAVGGYIRVEPAGMWPIEVGGAHYFTGQSEVPEGGSVDFELTTASIAACPWQPFGAPLHGCLGFEGGVLTATPRGLAVTAGPSRDPVLNLLLGLVFRPRIAGPLHLRAGLLAGLPLLQHEFAYQAPDGSFPTLFQTSQIHGRVDLGLGLSF